MASYFKSDIHIHCLFKFEVVKFTQGIVPFVYFKKIILGPESELVRITGQDLKISVARIYGHFLLLRRGYRYC